MYDKTILLDILLDDTCRTLDNDGKPYPPTAPVFVTVSQKMEERGSKITPKHVYVIVRENRNGYKDMILKHLGIKSSEEKLDSSCNSENSINTSGASTSPLHSKTFSLIISAEKWQTMKPVKKIYNKRVYWVMQSGWTDVIAEKLWQQQKLNCVFKFKKHNVHLNNEARHYIFFRGNCIECAATIECTLLKMPSENVDIIFKCVAKNICFTEHSKKRHLKGNRRAIAADVMIKQRKEAIIYRREEAKRLKEFGDKSPPILPSSAVLRKAKEERLLKQYGLIFSNPVLNLLNSAKYSKYTGSIINISLLPFYCMYWTPEQQLLYVARCKRDPEAFLTIDATGGIIKRESSQDSPIFLYQCVLVSKDGSVPIFQMISADHRALMISFFLRNIVARNVPIPRTVVTDFGWALLIAVSNVFAKCVNFQDYLQKCYDTVILGNINILPNCYIRLDVSHLIKIVARWKCLKGKEKMLVRVFNLRCISQAYLMDSFKDVQYLIESLLGVALSKTIGCTLDGKQLMSDICMQYLNNIIKGNVNNKTEVIINNNTSDESQETESSNDDIKLSDNSDYKNSDNADWMEWSNSILDAAKKIADESADGQIINACYNPEFVKQIKTRLLPYLPIWTGIMRPYFKRSSDIASSSSVEAEFCDLKHRGFKGQLPIRKDKFVMQHLDFLDAKITLASNENDIATKDVTLQSNKHENMIYVSMEVDVSNDKSSTTSMDKTDVEYDDNKDTNLKSVKNCFENTKDNVTDDVSSNISIKSNDSTYALYTDTVSKINSTNELDDTNNWNIRENWHGLTNSDNVADCLQELPKPVPVKRCKPSYLDKCPEWDYLKNSKSFNLPLLINGSTCKPTKQGQSIMTVQETCAFDSILQLVINGIAAHAAYRNAIEGSQGIFQLARSILEDGKVLSKHYDERASILKSLSLFSDAIINYTRGIKRLNANCNAAHLTEYVFKNEPSCVFTRSCSCGDVHSRQTITCHVNIDILLQEGLAYMQRAIDDIRNLKSKCHKCGTSTETSATYGKHIIIDTSLFTDYTYSKHNTDKKHNLDSIAKIITLNNTNYILIGIVNYIQSYQNNGHYTAFAYAGTHWYEYDDLKKKRITASPNQNITPHVIIYIRCE